MPTQKRLWLICGLVIVTLIYLIYQRSQLVVKANLYHSQGVASLTPSEKNLFWDSVKERKAANPILSQKNLAGLRRKILFTRDGQNITLELSSGNEKEARAILNSLSEAWKNYVNTKKDLRNSGFTRKIQELKKSLDESIEKLTEFQKANGILAVSNFEEREKNLKTALMEAEARLRQLESDFEMLLILDKNKNFSLRHMNVDLPAAQKYKELERLYHSSQIRYKSKHPKMKKLEAELKLLKENLFKELHQERGILLSQVASLKFSLEDIKDDFLKSSSLRGQLGEFEQNVELKRAQYQEAENQYQKWLASSPSHEISYTIETTSAFKQTVSHLAAVWLFVFLGLGVISFLDRRIYHPRHILTVHKEVGLLAVTPRVKSSDHKIPLFLHHRPSSPYAHSISIVKNRLLSMKNWNHRVILISTAGKGQSPVSLITNLSIALAQGQKRVLLVDCQINQPRQHHYFKIQNIGIATVLRGEAKTENVISRVEIPNLHILPAGEGLNLRQLCSEEFGGLLKELTPAYDFIFLDAPSFAAGTESILIAQKTNGVILTVPQGQVTRETLLWVKNELKQAGVPLLGVVLKEVPPFKVKPWNEFIMAKIETTA